ncbi:unnamed protein product [Gongylonema pulchrum]|uniref:Membrane-associated kinase regulator 6 n=1 Tax=Gongylonema pulchrum TaxID=637853 RepID=A0A183E3K2_9BILA|nr:unnamed protein product [Gongylonema pulchrum]
MKFFSFPHHFGRSQPTTKISSPSRTVDDIDLKQDAACKNNETYYKCLLKVAEPNCYETMKFPRKGVSSKNTLHMARPIAETSSSDEAAESASKNLLALMSPSRPASSTRTFKWEKLAMKSKSVYLRHRSQKMLKDRLEKYCVSAMQAEEKKSENLSSSEGSQASASSSLAVGKALPKFHAGRVSDEFELCSILRGTAAKRLFPVWFFPHIGYSSDRLEKYCVSAMQGEEKKSENLSSSEGSQASAFSSLAVGKALPKFHAGTFYKMLICKSSPILEKRCTYSCTGTHVEDMAYVNTEAVKQDAVGFSVTVMSELLELFVVC